MPLGIGFYSFERNLTVLFSSDAGTKEDNT